MKVLETIIEYPRILDAIEPLQNLEPENITRNGDSYLIVEKQKINDIRVGDSRIRPNQRIVYNIYLLAGLSGISRRIDRNNEQSSWVKNDTTIHFNINKQIGPHKGVSLILSIPIDGKGAIHRNVINEKIEMSLEKRGFSFPTMNLNASDDTDFIRVYEITPDLLETFYAILYHPSEGTGATGILFRELRDKAVSEYGMKAGKKNKKYIKNKKHTKTKKRLMKSKKNNSRNRLQKVSNKTSRKIRKNKIK
ncbi:MAG: hypothetical protein WD512_15280 [Candidatus Paceibacterota bacterium]